MGPGFVGIGMQKSGTRWLWAQLRSHPGAWLPPVKELHAIGRPFPSAKVRAALDRRRALAGRDAEWAEMVRGMGRARHLSPEAYGALFAPGEGRVTGEVTPAYSALPPEAVGRLAGAFPGLVALMMVRDPVERAWSALNDAVGDGKLGPEAVREAGALRAALAAPEAAGRSFPTRTHATWAASMPVTAILLDEVRAAPEAARARAARAVGLDPAGPWGAEAALNGKAGRARAAMTEELRGALAGWFAEELLACARLFGGAAEGWPGRYGL